MALEDGGFGPRGWSDDHVRALLEDPEVRTLVVDDGAPVAYVMFIIDRAYETVEMLSLAVLPGRRRQGLGRRLIGEMEREAAEEGALTVALCVRTDNQAAIDLYLSQGYGVLANCAGYYEDGTDAYMMVKHLEE